MPENLAVSNILSMFVKPNSSSTKSNDTYQNRDKRIPCDDSTLVVSDCLATFKGNPCILFVHTSSRFFAMPNSQTNLKTSAPGASASTLNRAKPVSMSPATIKREINRLSRELKRTQSDLTVERDCKNRVYAYILSNGHLENYVKWHKATSSIPSNALCLSAKVQHYVDSVNPEKR